MMIKIIKMIKIIQDDQDNPDDQDDQGSDVPPFSAMFFSFQKVPECIFHFQNSGQFWKSFSIYQKVTEINRFAYYIQSLGSRGPFIIV